ncbi:MAG: alginate export family protein [Aeoliella sp.]
MPKLQLFSSSVALLFIAATACPVAAQNEIRDAFDLSRPLSLAFESKAPDADQVSYCVASGKNCKCGCPSCCCKKKAKPNPCATSHKGVYYDNDFSYLSKGCYCSNCLGDCLKLMPVDRCGRWGTVDIGGQLRYRYHHEEGMGQVAGTTRFQDTQTDFLLTRLRLYTNWQISDNVRFYMEGIYADASGDEDYIHRPIDDNFCDLLNVFVDLKVSNTTTVRVGRQELLYGVQRTVSPLDWANTRRTFEGVKVMYRHCDWAIDGFYTGFVPVESNKFDDADYNQDFYGLYGVYSGMENATLDVYYLGYDDQRPLTTQPAGSRDFSLHTVGMRLNGSRGKWLYEFEGAPQFGRQSGIGLDHTAGFATAGIGRQLDMMWSPTVWVYYDYASGNNIGGDFNRYNQVFPLAHKYLGFIDATQRSNIESPNLLVKMKPHKKVDLLLWYYHLMANQDTDIVPSIGGTPAQSAGSKDWGDEIDVIVKYTFDPRSNLLVGYSRFWAGNKITPVGGAVDADFFYTQWELNF